MKGFIEVTRVKNGEVMLINVNNIDSICPTNNKNETWIYTHNEDRILCKESYDEVKALMAEALGEKPMPKVNIASIKSSDNSIAVGTFNGSITIDHKSNKTMHQKATNVVNIKSVDTLYS